MDARRFVAVLGLAGAMVFAGCSSSKSSTPATTSGLAGTATTQGGSSSTTAAGGGQKLTITPSSSLASPQTVQLEVETGRLVTLPVEGFPVIRHWYVVHRNDKRLSAATQAFRSLLLAQDPRGVDAQEGR